ncbi:hypothetical protein [Desulfosporosinus sp.]|uniref:hypothetical protein n=1 Tax=Desulfosporosinus sp. TaxID=157907 RepID=UPI0025C43461|nr:hypothetical protein [Desulfosporosinus sp.]MBC2723514.1 hypothetical protein [Desulfosporosinus sp.]MBC2728647.1 hypothetical protein [Desulfosporosinus sp.]
MSYEIIQKRGYVELWIDGKFAGSFDSEEEAMDESGIGKRGEVLMKEQITNKDQAHDVVMKIMHSPRVGWITKGSRAKTNEKIEISRVLAKELADKTLSFYLTLELLPSDPFCNCKQIEALLQKAVQELPEGDTQLTS